MLKRSLWKVFKYLTLLWVWNRGGARNHGHLASMQANIWSKIPFESITPLSKTSSFITKRVVVVSVILVGLSTIWNRLNDFNRERSCSTFTKFISKRLILKSPQLINPSTVGNIILKLSYILTRRPICYTDCKKLFLLLFLSKMVECFYY